jgi:hypothetical protein
MRRLTNWLIGIWMVICSALQVFPDVAMQVWMMMPDDLKSALPPFTVKAISYSVLVISMLAKMRGMKKENKALKNDSANPQG